MATRTLDGSFAKLAAWVGMNLTRAHRGAFVEHGKLIVFENNQYGGNRTVRQVDMVCSGLEKMGFTIEGLSFGESGEEDMTWMLVAVGPAFWEAESLVSDVTALVWQAWLKVCRLKKEDRGRYTAYESQEALEAICDRPTLPKSLVKAKKTAA